MGLTLRLWDVDMWLLFLGLLGCAGNIHALYEEAKTDALQSLGPPPSTWSPDIQVQIRPRALQDVATSALDAGLLSWERSQEIDTPVGLTISLTPSAAVEHLRLRPSDACNTCLSVVSNLSGSARWQAGRQQGSVPYTARLGAVLELALEDAGEQTILRARIKEINRVKLSSNGMVLNISTDDAIGKWVRRALRNTPAFTVTEFGGEGLPVRAVSLRVTEEGIWLDALSDVDGAALDGNPPALADEQDWAVRMSDSTLTALLRRKAFSVGLLDNDLGIEPQFITTDGDQFTLGLRLWRLSGRGWWRDYEATGSLSVDGRRLVMQATDATEGDKSPGAGLADPLALLVEGRILDAVVDNLEQTLPGTRSTTAQGMKISAVTQSIGGMGNALVVQGQLRSQTVD